MMPARADHGRQGLPKPKGFAWCPDELWSAYQKGRGYKGIPPDVLQTFLNAPYRETIADMLVQPGSGVVIARLMQAKRRPQFSVEQALHHAIHTAAMPAKAFTTSLDWQKARADLDKLNRSIRKLHGSLNIADVGALQVQADDMTDFSRTGRRLAVSRLIDRIRQDTALLKELCERPPPASADIVPRKRAADRMEATLKARLLKREFRRIYTRPNYNLIADLINLADAPTPLLEDDDVRKA